LISLKRDQREKKVVEATRHKERGGKETAITTKKPPASFSIRRKKRRAKKRRFHIAADRKGEESLQRMVQGERSVPRKEKAHT